MSTTEVGSIGERIAASLWRLQKAPEAADRAGVDFWCMDTGKRVQVKTDTEICFTGNLYLEIFEKTKGRPDQKWRLSPHDCDEYIFVTHGYAVRVPVWMIASVCMGQNIGPLHLREINPTSIGVLLSVALFERADWRDHDLWPANGSDRSRRVLHWYFRREKPEAE